MTTQTEALKLIADIASGSTTANSLQHIANIAQEALAQPEQEPLCTAAMFDDAFLAKSGLSPDTKLYTTPPQRKPLTDEMKKQCPYTAYPSQQAAFMEGWLKAEAAHGIKE